jgi:hypothetical protein
MLTTGFMCLRCHVSKRSMHTDIIKQIMTTSYWRNTAISRQVYKNCQTLYTVIFWRIILSFRIMSSPILSCMILTRTILSCMIMSRIILSHMIWSYMILSRVLWSRAFLFCLWSMQTRIAGICKQSGWIQKLPGICIPQLHTECIQELLAFVNRRAEYRNCQALHIAITYSMSTTIAGICKQSGWIQRLSSICIPQLHTQCIPELLAFANNRAEYRNCQAFVYRNCRLNLYRESLAL